MKQNYSALRNTFGVREKTLTQLKEPRLGLEEKISEYSKPWTFDLLVTSSLM